MSYEDNPNEMSERPRYRDYNHPRPRHSFSRPYPKRRDRDSDHKRQQNRSRQDRSNGRHDFRDNGRSFGGTEVQGPSSSSRHRTQRAQRESPYDMAHHRGGSFQPRELPLQLQWLGIWEVRGQSRWNGCRMEVSVTRDNSDDSRYDIILKDVKRNQKFKLNLNPQNTGVAYWHLPDKKKNSHREYAGTLSEPPFGKVVWRDMNRRRRVDHWHRLDYLHPDLYPPKSSVLNVSRGHSSRKRTVDAARSKTEPTNQRNAAHGRLREKDRVYKPKDSRGKDASPPTNTIEPTRPPFTPDIRDHEAIESQLAKNNRRQGNGSAQNGRSNGDRKKFQLIPSPQHRPQRSSPLVQSHAHAPSYQHDAVLNDPAVLHASRSPETKMLHRMGKRPKYMASPYENRHSHNRNRGSMRRDKRSDRRRLDDRRNRGGRGTRKQRMMRHKHRSRKPRYSRHVKGTELQRLLASDVAFEGTLKILPHKPILAHVHVPELKRVVRVEGLLARNRAFHGDKVVVRLKPFCDWKAAVNVELMEFERRLDARSEQFEEDRNVHDLDDEEADSGGDSGSGSLYDGVDVESVLEDVEDLDEDDLEVPNPPEESIDDFCLDSAPELSDLPTAEDDGDEGVRKVNKLIAEYVAEESEVVAGIVAQHMSPVLRPISLESSFSEISPPEVEATQAILESHISPKQEESPQEPRLGPPSANIVLSLISQYTQNIQAPQTSQLSSGLWESTPHPNDYVGYIPVGDVIAITEPGDRRRLRTVSGYLDTISPKKQPGRISGNWAMFMPLDKRMPKALFDLRECPRELEHLLDHPERLKMRFLETAYKYATWDEWNTYCTAKFVRMLGKRGNIETETRIILNAHGVRHSAEFDSTIREECSSMKIDTDANAISDRRDCRDWPVFTIDPSTAQDFDDAISIVKKENNEFEIGIHIADVTHFVKPGSRLDAEARDRATSVYLVDRCIPMLPHVLCHELCSLNPGVDRYAFSVIFRLTGEAELVENSVWFGRTIIRSKARLDYATAHDMIVENIRADYDVTQFPECVTITEETNLENVIRDVSLFWNLARSLRSSRFQNGSVRFSKPCIRFRLDERHQPVLMGTEQNLHSQSLIEEFMLMANKLVAQHLIGKCRSQAVLRRHPPPNEEGLTRVKLIARSQRLKMDVSSSRKLNECLDEWSTKKYANDVSARSILVNMITKKMSRAEYFCVDDTDESQWSHYGLNFDAYTHFTSPIRRYADVIVHRLLQDTLCETKSVLSPDQLKEICTRCNERAECASKAEFASQTVHLCLYVLQNPLIVDAFIVDMRRHHFDVVVPVLGIQTDVRLSRIGAANATILLQLPDSQLVIQWHADDTEETYQLFSKIQLRLSSELATPIRLITTVISPEHRFEVVPSVREQQRMNDSDRTHDDFLNRHFD